MASGTHAADNYYYTAPVADFATTAYPWTAVTGCSLSFTPGSTTENWLVIATGQVRDSSTGEAQEAHVRLRVGGTVEAEGGVQSNPANAETGFFMMHRITGTTALQNIDVQAQDPFNNLTTTTVEQCSITAFRIPSNADFQWTEVDGAIGNCPDAGATILTHQFTPSSAGDYLYIVSFASFENPGGSTNKTWIDYPIAVTDAPDFNTEEAWSNGRDPRQTYVSIREEILPASLQTLSVVCDGSGGTAPDIDSTMRWAKVASFRLDAFEADYHDEDLTEVPLITSNVWTTHSTLTQAAPAGSREFIMLGTISGCTNDANPGPQHGMRFREDSTVQGDSVWGVNRDCGYTNGFHNSFQWVEPYTTASAKIWDNQYQSTDNLTEARFAESAIHVLQFPYSGIAFRSADSAGVASGNLTINKPTGTVQDDVMIGTIGVRPETVTITPPAGWTLVRRINNANANANSLAVYYKVAGASEPASYTWTISANTGVAGGIQTFSGVDTTNPIDVENGQNTPNGLDHATPSVDTTVDNAMLVTSHTFSSAATWTEPTGMTEGFDVLGGLQATEGNHVLQPTAGATGAKTATAAADADVGNAHILALRPATTGAATTTIGDGTSPGNKSVAQSSTNNAVDAFTLATDTGTDTVTALTVTFTGTDVNDVAASGVKIYEDNGGTANEWDATDTLIDTASFSGTTASFTGLNISVNTTATQYLVTYDIEAGATVSNTLQGAITAATVSNTLVNNDTTDATLTVVGATITFQMGDGKGAPSETDDAWLDASLPDANNGTAVDLEIDTSTNEYHTLIKFPNIFGGGASQIPLGSTIHSATLTVEVFDTGDDPDVYQLVESWVEGEVTWNSRSTGVSWTDPGADGTTSRKSTLEGTISAGTAGPQSVDVTTSVQNWSDGETNEGWLFEDTGSGGVRFRSSEYGTASERPKLTVCYTLPATTTIGDGTSPGNKSVAPSSTNNAVDAFTLATDTGTDTVTALTVTFTGTDVNDVAASGVKIYEDNGGTANEWDATDTLIDTASFSGTTASFTGLNISVNTTATQYLVTYDIAPGATASNTLQGAITAATVSNTLVNNDTIDATLTISVPTPELTQLQYRWYENIDAIQPTNPLAAEDTFATISTTTNPVRLRMNATVSGTALGGSSQAFKLQYATDTGGPWTDVGTGEGTLVLVNPNTQVADQLTGLSGTTPTDTELVGLELSTTSTTSTVSEIVVNLSYTGIVDGDVDNFRLYKDLGTIGTYESGTDTLVDTVAGNPTSGTVTFASLSESIGISPTHYLIIYDFANALSASDQITASIGPADITTTAAAKSGDLTNEPTHTATASGSVGFTDYTATAGVGNVGTAFAITWEDYDNDGHLDLWIGGDGQLYKNDGNGPTWSFTASAEAPTGARGGNWVDADNGGDMDLFATLQGYFYDNNGDTTFTERAAAANLVGSNLGTTVALDYDDDGDTDFFFSNGNAPFNEIRDNNGSGTFTTVDCTGIGCDTGENNGETSAVADVDNDGDADIYYNADGSARLYYNNGGTFSENAAGAGIVTAMGGNQPYYAPVFGDYNNDGWLDLFLGHPTGIDSQLYLNDGDGTFTRQTAAAPDANLGHARGAAWGDYDNDGDLDLLVGVDGGANMLFRNDGGGTFTDVAGSLGIQNGTAATKSASFADYDNDGDLEIYYSNESQANVLFRNDLNNANYLKVKVVGKGAGFAPRDGIGSRVELWDSTGTTLLAIREVSGGEGYGSFPSRIQHFGLAPSWGGGTGTYTVKVKFTSGTVVTRSVVVPVNESITVGATSLNQTIEIHEGELALANPSTQVVNQLGGEAGNTPTDVELVGLRLNTFTSTANVSQIVVNLSYTGIVDGDVNNFRLYQDLGTIGTYESGTDTTVATVAGNPTSGTVTFGGLSESIGTSGPHYLVIYNVVNPLSADDQITASIDPSDITTAAPLISGDLTDEPTHTAASIGAWQFYDNSSVADGATITSTLLSASEVNESYGESNPTASNPNDIPVGQEGEWDYALDPANATYTTYYFRMVKSDGTPFNSYTNYPIIDFTGVFQYRKSITVPAANLGGNCSADLDDFPLLISITDTDLRDKTRSDGYDIVFRWDDGTCGGSPCQGLYHEIERWNSSTGELIAWVRIPTLSESSDTTIYMYYGNPYVDQATENPTGVWDSSYVGVWHLNETTGSHYDSTSGNNGTPGGGVIQDASGKIDGADDFDGNDDYVEVGTTGFSTTNMTFSAWVKADALADRRYIFGHTTQPAFANRIQLYTAGTAPTVLGLGLGDTHAKDTGSTLSIGPWYHVVLVKDATNYWVYLNTALDMSGTYTGLSALQTYADIGNDGNPSERTESWNGVIDEVRISDTPRSTCWIETEYSNQNNPAGFYNMGPEEGPGVATAVNLTSFTAKGEGSNVLVEWETAQELNHMGFHLYRASNPWGPFTRLTDKLLSGLTSSVVGRKYSFEDKDVTPGELYYYRLEDIDIYGEKTVHGPISVDWDGDGLPDDWEIAHGLNPGSNDAHLDLDGDGLTNWEEYLRGTDPLNPDTDGDGILDGEDRETDTDSQGGVRTLSPGVYILAADETGITLELRTDSFDSTILEAEGQEFERLKINEYIHGFTHEVGKPELPLKGILVDIPEGNSATLSVLQIEDELHTGYQVYPVPEKAVDDQAQLAHVGEIFVLDEAAYSVDSFYPEAVAHLGEQYIFRGQQKQQILFSPLTFNPATGEIRHYRRIRVRVDYAVGEWAKAAGPKPTVWSPSVADEGSKDFSSFVKMAFLTPSLMVNPIASVLSSAAILVRAIWAPPAAATPAYKILVVEDGIYRLTKTWLEAQGVDVSGFDLSQVRIYNLGQEIAIYVYDENGDDQFDPEDYIYFYGRAVEEGYAKYTTDNVYWLTLEGGAGAPKRMEAIDGAPGSGSIPSTHSFSLHHEEDREYWARAPGGDELDRYFFQPYVVGADVAYIPPAGDPNPGDPVSFDLFLPGAADQGTLKIMLGGSWDTNHQVDISVNGIPVGTYGWSGIAFYEATISPVDLVDGMNTVTLECLTGQDSIAVDWFEVTYPRRFEANADLLTFSHDTGYRFQVSEFSGDNLLAFDITSPENVEQVVNFQTIDTGGPGPYTLDFEPPSGSGEKTYVVLTSDQVLDPDAIIEDEDGNLADPATGADYILITHRDLGWEDINGDPHQWLSDITALRQAQGLRVKVVDVDDIFDEFSYGIATPEAILDFLAYAYISWTPPAPQYVLIVGDSTRNPKNNPDPWFGVDTVATYLPTYLTVTDHMGETATDEWFVRVSGDDAISDLYIGRLPAKSVAEAGVMVNKILAYEGSLNTKSWEKNVLFLADDQRDGPEYEYEAVFEIMNNDAAALLPAAMNDPVTGYLNDYFDADNLKAEIIAQINSGTLMVNYSGHSSIQRLANPNIFNTADVATLTNSGMYPLFVGMGCLSGNFVYPEDWNYPSLAEALLRAEDKGAAAALMSTGLTTTEGQHILNTALFDAVFNQDVRVLGQAVSAAKQILIANGDSLYEEVNETFLLFGDPAMALKVPLPQRPEGLRAQGNGNAVDLSWDEATDCNGGAVSGYNLYRSTTPGGTYTKVNASFITESQYDDTSVVPGTTYYYVVTSVDADGDESAQSQETNGGTQSANSEASGGGGGGGCFINSVKAQ